MTEDKEQESSIYQRVLGFVSAYRMPIFGWCILIASVVLLWVFREHLTGLASALWPIVVGATIIGFRHELSNLLKRIKSFGKEGMQFRDEQIAAQIVAVPVSDALKDVAPGEEHSEVIQSKVASMRLELNARVPEDAVKREHLLILRLVEAQQARDFFYIWMQIFSSQLDALVKMASESGSVDLSDFFEVHKSRVDALPNPHAVKVSFDAWAGYFGRMQIAGINQTFGIITPLGREFLAFATTQNLPRFQAL